MNATLTACRVFVAAAAPGGRHFYLKAKKTTR